MQEVTAEDDIERMAAYISILFGIEDPLNLTATEFAQYASKVAFLGEAIPSNERGLASSYTINGTTYTFHGNVLSMNMGQLMDWRQYTSKENIDYAECLSVFIIPEGHKYNDGYDMDKTINDIDSLPITTIMRMYDFFLQGLRLYIHISRAYLKRLLKKEKKKAAHKQ